MSPNAQVPSDWNRNALGIYAVWLKEDPANRFSFQELCEKNAELATELRELHHLTATAQTLFAQESLRARFGPEAELELTLDDEPGSDSAAAELEVFPPARYTVQGEVARGGMGVIYRVRDRELNRTLAMKVMLGDSNSAAVEEKRATMLARFVEEVQLTAQLDHPGIVTVHELGADAEGRPYFTMKLVKGRDLAHVFKLASAEQEGWSLPRAVGTLIKACQAVAYAHSKGVVHRDLKPANVMVGRFGEVYVMDWGLAKIKGRKDPRDLRLRLEPASLTEIRTPRSRQHDSGEDSPLITMDGSVVGTPAFMPPEQAKGQIEQVDALSDIYSLGAMLYTLLAGRAPYTEPDTRLSPHTLLAMVLQGPPKRLHLFNPTAPPELVAICEKAMAREKDRRYQSSLDLAEDLQAWLDRRVVKAYRTGALAELKSWVVRNPGTALASAVALLLLLATVGFVSHQNRQLIRQRAEITHQRNAARENLYTSLLREAAATRAARTPGYRERAFDLLAQASALEVPTRSVFELRSQAVACLGDFAGLRATALEGFPTNQLLNTFESSDSLLALGFNGGVIQLRELPSGNISAELDGERPLHSLAFNSAGDELFSLHLPGDLPAGQPTQQMQLRRWKRGPRGWTALSYKEEPGALAVLPAGSRVWVAIRDNVGKALRLIDAETEALLHRISLPDARSRRMHFALSADARLLALSPLDERGATEATYVIDLNSDARTELKNRADWLLDLVFSNDGQHLACVYHTGAAIFRTSDFQRVAEVPEHLDTGCKVAFSPSGKLLALPLYQQGRTRVVDWAQGKDLVTLRLPSYQTAFSKDGRFLFGETGSSFVLQPFDTRAEKLTLPVHPGGTPGVVFSPDATRIASIGKDRVLRMSDAVNGRTLWESGPVPGLGQCVAFDPSGRFLASSSFGTTLVCLWDARTGNKLREVGPNQVGNGWSVCFSPDGRLLAPASEDRLGSNTNRCALRVWRLAPADGEPLRIDAELLASLPGDFVNASFSADGERLLFFQHSQADFSLLTWAFPFQAGQASRIWSFDDIWWHWQAGGLTPDGRGVIVHQRHGPIVRIDLATRQETPISGQERYGGMGLALSPDGRTAACIDASSASVWIWDVASAQMRYFLPEENGSVWWMAWSPDSHRLALSRSSGEISVWNLAEVNAILHRLDFDRASSR